jgi:peptide/nickel transport system substrate-binding protein
VAVGLGGVWVPLALDDELAEIDPATNRIARRIRVGRFPSGITIGFGSVWVANSRDGTISRVDPIAGRVVATIHVGGSPERLVVAAGRVWVSVQEDAFAPRGGVRGGVARVVAHADLGTLDPALAWLPVALQIEFATCAKLVNYSDRAGPGGGKVVPDVARTPPTVSPDGRTYTFTLRRDFRFSPPSNELVTPRTFKYSIERSLDPRMQGSAGTGRSAAEVTAALDDVVGAKEFERGAATHISGITAGAHTLTIRLLRPAGDLLARLATSYYCAVPIGTPIRPAGVDSVPAAGPYYVAAYTPGVRVVLQRNPNYRGRRPHRLDEIDIALGVAPARAVAEVESGAADYLADGLPQAEAPRIAARYGSGRRGEDDPRYLAHPAAEISFLAFNTSRRLFSDVRLRRAVSFAIDRTAFARVSPAFSFPVVENDRLLPPGMPGYVSHRRYPARPAVAEARRLSGNKQRSAVLYLGGGPIYDEVVRIVHRDLRPLGIRVVVRKFPTRELYDRMGREGEPYDLAFGGWRADYYDPAAFLNTLLDGPYVGAPERLNTARFSDPLYRRRLEAAERLSGHARATAYTKLADDLAVVAVPWAGITTEVQQDFLSARMGCAVFHPLYRLDLAALCVRPASAASR